MAEPRIEDLEVQRLSYSRAPWRIVHKASGREVRCESAEFLPGVVLPVPGYERKRDAVAALGRLGERLAGE